MPTPIKKTIRPAHRSIGRKLRRVAATEVAIASNMFEFRRSSR
jgi:hypothetical protein